MQLTWDSIGISHNHAGYVEDGWYTPADVYESHRADFVGVHLEPAFDKVEPRRAHRAALIGRGPYQLLRTP
jgi:hypothetical protein